MKKLLILFLFIGMFLCFEGGFISKEVSAQVYSTAIIVQCPYCHTTYSVYGSGTYRCSNCGNYFEVVPGTISAPPPVIITPPPPVYYYPYYPYYPGWYGCGPYGFYRFNLFFGFGHGHRHFEHRHEHFEHGRGHHR